LITKIARRDFLKISAGYIAGAALARALPALSKSANDRANVVIILCDALSARHLSLYGYPRLTTPNLDAFAARSAVFHNHYSGGNFTISGTASMLTGMLPWTHRAINYSGVIASNIQSNLYAALGSDYYRFAFAQNPWADRLIGQCNADIDRFLAPSAHSLDDGDALIGAFENDHTLAAIALNDFLFPAWSPNAPAGSVALGYLNKSRVLNFSNRQNSPRYSKGVPNAGYATPYMNETIYAGAYAEIMRLETQASPYFAYFHLYSPHYPYCPRNDYQKLFHDNYLPAQKPLHPSLRENIELGFLLTQRALYDRQIAQVDAEFGKLMARLDESGALRNAYVIFTADHGELFERGVWGHGSKFLYEDVIRIPLMIRAPGQTQRADVFTPTSNVDILPTILSLAGKPLASEMDGKILPGFGGQIADDRPIFSIAAIENSAFTPITKAAIAMRKRARKLIAYLGYDFGQPFELYDLENDPEELKNLASKDAQTLSTMKDELFTHLNAANQAFAKRISE
jgi:arylsulfatase A-like enzyme